mgnify:CR=1 FL=1
MIQELTSDNQCLCGLRGRGLRINAAPFFRIADGAVTLEYNWGAEGFINGAIVCAGRCLVESLAARARSWHTRQDHAGRFYAGRTRRIEDVPRNHMTATNQHSAISGSVAADTVPDPDTLLLLRRFRHIDPVR